MNKLQFVKLIAYVAYLVAKGDDFVGYNIEHIETLTNVVSETKQNPETRVDAKLIDELMKAILDQRKIDAIRAHRALTGFGLKESKDAVEKYWLTAPTKVAND